MKHLKIAGLCLVAMLAVGMVAAGTAQAKWEQCTEGGTTTKYTEHQCRVASATGNWSWQEVKGTEEVVSHGSLVLRDTKVPIIGTVEVQCTGKDEGSVGPGQLDRVEKITEIKCSPGKNCEKITKETKPENLPWQTEIVTSGSEKRDNIKATNGKGAGWGVTCRVLGIEETDECVTEEGTTALANQLTNNELLVLATFDKNTAKANCKIGGAKSGEVLGTDAILKTNGWGLRFS